MKKAVWIILILILFYTRFINLSWGLPYPFHPDERNMAVAVMQLTCTTAPSFNVKECFNPHFFAYGQFPLYIASFFSHGIHSISSGIGPVSLNDAILALRTISALASVIMVFILDKIIHLFREKKSDAISFACFIFVPCFIQFAHFGTTESLIMLEVALLTYFSMRIVRGENIHRYLVYAGIIAGFAAATKVSTVVFILFPLFALIPHLRKTDGRSVFACAVRYTGILLLVFIICSPHNFISFPDFLGSMRYEGDVGIGAVIPFYTRQFLFETPIVFQLQRIFPYALGWPFFLFFLIGLFFLPWKNKQILFLRLAVLVTFLPVAFVFAKWTRFIAPVFPLAMIFAVLTIYKVNDYLHVRLKKQNGLTSVVMWFVVLICIVPGIAYLSIYQNEDVRFKASRWIYQHIPNSASILSETANVVDIPFPVPSDSDDQLEKQYRLNSFNFYELDNEPQLPSELSVALEEADFIFVPSRRIFKNLTCEVGEYFGDSLGRYLSSEEKCKMLEKQFPLVNYYYRNLFTQSEAEKQGISHVQSFTSFPRIELFGKTLIEFPDEEAEESWTVFDHPVIRIYKKETI